MNIKRILKRILKISLKVILWFIAINIIVMFIIAAFDGKYRYINLRNKKDLTPTEQSLINKKPNTALYYMVTGDSTFYYYEYHSGVLVSDGGFYKINPHTGRRIRR